MIDRARHPWVASLKGRIAFSLHATAAHSQGEGIAALIEAGRLAEKHGFDAFFLGDHPAWAPECWLTLSVIAASTSRIRLGQMVAAVPYRTPLYTARLQSDLDRLSGGRSILGLGIGLEAEGQWCPARPSGQERHRERQGPDHGARPTTTPQGSSPTGIFLSTFMDSVSTTVTSFDGPLAV